MRPPGYLREAYTIRETAQLLSLDTSAVERLIDTGQLMPIILDGTRLVLASDIDGLLRAYKQVAERNALVTRPKQPGKNNRRKRRKNYV